MTMTATDTTRRLMAYFASTYPRRVYGPRDFNSQVMANVFDPQDRATLGTALEQLLAAGFLETSPPNDFRITDAGLVVVRQCRQHPESIHAGALLPA